MQLFFQDCDQPYVADRPPEPSAFSAYNMKSGPFFDVSDRPEPPKFSRRSGPVNEESLLDEWGQDAPIDVGKRGRIKAKEKLEKQEREMNQRADDSEEDWFAKIERTRSDRLRDSPGGDDRSKKPSLGLSLGLSLETRLSQPRHNARNPNQNRSHRSLLDRLGQPDESLAGVSHSQSRERQPRSHPVRGGNSRYSRDVRYNDRRKDQAPRDWINRDRFNDRRNDIGPRYKGGYDR